MGNLWLMIGHGVRQKIEGILVRSRACVGGGDANTKMGQVAKAKQALLRSTRYLGTNCLLCALLYNALAYVWMMRKKIDTYLSRPIAKSVHWAKALRR